MSRWTPEGCWIGHAPGDNAASTDTPLRRFDEWCAAHPGRRCVVWLGSGLMVPLVADDDLDLRDEAALRGWARRVLAHYGVAPTAPLATWRSGRRLGVVALEGVDLPDLQAVAARHRVRVVGVRPGWALALQGAGQRQALADGDTGRPTRIWLKEPALWTVLTVDGGRLSGIDVRWTSAGHDLGDGETHDATEDVDLPDARPAPGEPVFDAPTADCPAGGPATPDFLAPAVRHESAAGWALAAAGVLVLGVALSDAGWLDDLASSAPSVPVVTAIERGGASGPPVTLAWTARVDHPWPAVFAAAENASLPGVRWTRFEHDAVRRDLRLSGQAPSVTVALAAAERLTQTRPVQDALLAQVEPVKPSMPGEDGSVRFELQARIGAEVRAVPARSTEQAP